MRDEKLRFFAADHLAYEINMCQRTARLLLAFGAERHTLTNALLESYALHMRNLIEFLYDDPKRSDDVRAVQYVESKSQWLSARGTLPPLLKETRGRADKQVAHLTKKRFADGMPQKNWRPVVEIAELLPGLLLFLVHARPALIPNVARAINTLSAIVNSAPKEA